eukprot:CAMPEP_0178443810 /NCGR_PEP_ID=MMETSP0689_2-20121128/39117_1 /TAXON_ID=160604 /ORGANISM="Amphidinium massartii, Strain CS-259" /LENGTH=272 /DNA_ID=CAMNT_0020067889 /DNA_START=108 /DNA_END=926 /DNA_ORIENTATION=-
MAGAVDIKQAKAKEGATAHTGSHAFLGHVGGAEESTGFVKPLEFKHKLRVCNAYPLAANVDVFRGKEKLTEDSPMSYKSCRDFSSTLKSGDKLEFKVGDANAGTFAVSELPETDAVLLLIIHRHDSLSTAVSFESHVFANLLNAQVAVIDTYKGSSKTTMKIKDADGASASSREEDLRYDSVVAVNPGRYEVVLEDKDGKPESKSELVALNRESYVVLRTGVEAHNGPSYPQELIVFPHSDIASLRSGAVRGSKFLGTSLAIILAAVLSSTM